MSIAASLMILVSVFTDQWLIGPPAPGGEAPSMGLFGGQDICVPMDNMLFEGGIACLVAGLATMVLTVALSLLTPCLRTCCCCSVFTCCGSLQSFAAVLFTMGLLAYPAGWGSDQVRQICGPSDSFVLGHCKLGGAFWMAVAGTVCTFLASSLTVFAYKSTKSHKTLYRRQDGDMVICVP